VLSKSLDSFLGIVSLTDLIIGPVAQEIFAQHDTESKLAKVNGSDLKVSAGKVQAFAKTLEEVLKSRPANSWLYDKNDQLTKLVDAFSVGLHRVVVTDQKNPTFVSYISQTDVVKFILKEASQQDSQIGGLLQKTVGELKMGVPADGKVITLPTTSSALQGFRSMVNGSHLQALPLVDQQGVLVDNLSNADFRPITSKNFDDLLLPAPQFLAKVRKDVHKTATCTILTKLSDVMNSLLTNKVHRLWLINTKNIPVGVISLTDVITKFSVYDDLIEHDYALSSLSLGAAEAQAKVPRWAHTPVGAPKGF